MSQEWNALSAAQKEPFIKESEENKKRYNEAMTAYKAMKAA